LKYLLLIYQKEAQFAGTSPDERASSLAEYDQFNATYGAKGALRGGAELQPTGSATSVRVRGGEALLTDGPFAETKEQLAGYYVVECETLDEALEIAAAIPSARIGTIEVRPQVEGMGPSAG
jgi:hypothetical protein